jgi:4-nitrophenyl phosphatase
LVIAALESGLKKPGGEGLICEKIVTGKPNPAIFDLIMGHHKIEQSEKPKMVFIGDRPDTDISLGYNGGVDTCLVLSGVVTCEEEAHQWAAKSEKFKPTWVLDSFGDAYE